MRVPEFLTEQCVAFETVIHPPVYTAQKRARRLHVSGRQLAKCVLLWQGGGHVLGVLPASYQVDLEALARQLKGPVRLATETEAAEVFRDCEWGTMTPFGTLYGLPTLLDALFDPDAVIVFESQRHHLTIRMRCWDFERLEQPRRLRFARPLLTVRAGSVSDG
jgi:Ala-tRNA(Pro) deacylase